jgi:hypothetical protein
VRRPNETRTDEPPARRRTRERGAAIVEFAIVFPLFFLLVSGIIDFGQAYSDLNSARQGVREGARQVVVANFGDDGGCAVVGAAPNDPTHRAICLTKDRVGMSASETRVKIAFTGANQVGDSVVVCAQRPMRSITGVFSPVMSGRAITTKVQMRIEKVDPEVQAVAETALPGTDWSWCA